MNIQVESVNDIVKRLYGDSAVSQLARWNLERPEDAPKPEDRVAAVLRSARHVEGDPEELLTTGRYMLRAGLRLAHVGRSPEATTDRLIVRFVVSSGEDARDNRHVHVEGLDYRAWDENPIVPWCHIYDDLPMGRGVWRGIYKRGGTHELWKDVEIMPADINPFAHRVGLALAGGWFRGMSASWISDKVKQEEVNGRTLLATMKGEYLEGSICPLPVDRWALAEAKSRGILLPEDLERIKASRDWRSLSRGIAYEVSPMDVVTIVDTGKTEHDDGLREALTRAFGDEEGRKLIDEAHLDPENKLGSLLGYEGRAVAETPKTIERAVAAEPAPAMAKPVTPKRPQFRGMLSEEVDGHWDDLEASARILWEAVGRMYPLTQFLFASGRSLARRVLTDAGIEAASIDALERFYASEWGDLQPENEQELFSMFRRQLSRVGKALERADLSIQGMRDAFNGNTLIARDEADEALEDALERALSDATRAGAKISKARLNNLKAMRQILDDIISEAGEAEKEEADDSRAVEYAQPHESITQRMQRLRGDPTAPSTDVRARLAALTGGAA